MTEEEEEVSVFPPLSNESIRETVRLWRHDQAQATEKYNHINKWNTSQVTDMSELFRNYEEFNDNISEWDVSNVTNMSSMFYGASSFNQDLSEWDVSNVTNMSHTFFDTLSFNQVVSKWEVSNVTHMSYMFCGSSSFNQDVSGWDVSNVINMSGMFNEASSFNQDISGWDVSNVVNMSYMFHGASSFNQDVSKWDVFSVMTSRNMFAGTKIHFVLRNCFSFDSFFGPDCRAMSRVERQQFFSVAFPWSRRRSFLMFLVFQRYLLHSTERTSEPEYVPQPCDVLFDVEDLDREVCKFL